MKTLSCGMWNNWSGARLGDKCLVHGSPNTGQRDVCLALGTPSDHQHLKLKCFSLWIMRMKRSSVTGLEWPYAVLFWILLTFLCYFPFLFHSFSPLCFLNLSFLYYFTLLLILSLSHSLTSLCLPLSPFPSLCLRLPVRSLLGCFTSSSWLHSPGCVWRGCSSICCWWRCLRASTPARSTTTCVATASQLWWWASRQP